MAELPRRLLAVALALATLGSGAATAGDGTHWLGQWRITRGVPAPWADSPTTVPAGLIGHALTLGDKASEGPGVLQCKDANFQPTRVPAEGLFQGNLPVPAQDAARSLGLGQFPVDGLSYSCSSGVFEFHAAAPDSMLLALDNVIWTLDRTAGTQAAPGSPEGVVQALLETHFAGDMGFLPPLVAAKNEWLSRGLQQKIAVYFAQPRPEDEVPPIDGDPFTDSQDYPARFAVRAGHGDAKTQEVPVELADAWQQRRLVYRLVAEDGSWRLDDIVFEHGTLRGLLAQ